MGETISKIKEKCSKPNERIENMKSLLQSSKFGDIVLIKSKTKLDTTNKVSFVKLKSELDVIIRCI
jgi:hypothetical protein